MKITTKLCIGLGVLVILSPAGLILPSKLKAGSGWGEWGAAEINKLIGYIPKGFEKLSGLWNAPVPGYSFRGWGTKGLAHLSFASIVSAVTGIAITALLVILLGKLLVRKNK